MKRLRASWMRLPAGVGPALRLTALAFCLPVCLPRVRLDRLARALTPSRGRPLSPAQLAALERYARRIGRWTSWPKSGACLIVSLMQYHLRRSCGQPVVFHCGVHRVGDRLEGHAWLSLEGRPILNEGRLADQYRVIFSYPAPGGPAAPLQAETERVAGWS